MRHDWCNGTCETCPEKPELLKDMPIGMYHCPGCLMMLVAGIRHLTCEESDKAMEGAGKQSEFNCDVCSDDGDPCPNCSAA